MAQTLTRTFPDGDYPSRLLDLLNAYELALKDEQKNPPTLLGGEDLPSEELAAEYEALKAEAAIDAAAKRRTVTLRALGRKQWRPLKEAHPPRAGEGVDEDTAKGDRLAGVNTDTVEDDLVHRSIDSPESLACAKKPNDNKACSGDATCANRAEFDAWSDELSQGEWNTLVRDAWRLVNVAQYDPKSLQPSRTQTGGES